jgi:acetyl esterase/lipase
MGIEEEAMRMQLSMSVRTRTREPNERGLPVLDGTGQGVPRWAGRGAGGGRRRRLLASAALWILVAVAQNAAAGVTGSNLVYATFTTRAGDPGQILLDVYVPAGPVPSQGWPALVLVHGGAFKNGGKGPLQFDGSACMKNCWHAEGQRAADSGFAAFVIDYRLACSTANPPLNITGPDLCGFTFTTPPEDAHAAVNDVHVAVQWVRDHASDCGLGGVIDCHLSGTVGVLGGSAGGNLSAMAGVTDDEPSFGSGKADAVALWSPDLTPQKTYIGCSPSKCPTDWDLANPTMHVSSSDAPTYVANSEAEIMPVAEAQALSDSLTNSGVPNFLRVVPGGRHERKYIDVVVTSSLCGGDCTVWDETMTFLHTYLE